MSHGVHDLLHALNSQMSKIDGNEIMTTLLAYVQRKAALASVLDDDMAVTSAEDVALSAPAAQDEVMAEAGPPETAGRSPTSEQAASSAAPEQAATSAAPDQAASVAAPDQALASAAPEQAAISAQPEQATVAAAPEQAVGSAVPDQDAAGNAAASALEVCEAGGEEEGSRDWAAALVGSQYETVLLAMLEGLRQDRHPDFDPNLKSTLFPCILLRCCNMRVMFGIRST